MSVQAELPRRFPVGTRYVIEGRAGRIHLQYLEFPDGRRVDMASDAAARPRSRGNLAPARRGRRRGGKKI